MISIPFLELGQDKQEREEEERKRRIQLYVFISRCITYPFNAKQPTDMTRRHTKITKQQLETIQGRFQVSCKSFIYLFCDSDQFNTQSLNCNIIKIMITIVNIITIYKFCM
jgi:hypothetical protein